MVDTSTIAPDAAREVALTLAERGIDYLDAPVSGGVPGAEAGTLSCMVGGDTAVFGRMRRVLEPFASRITLLGGTGAGQVAKAVNQLIVLGTIELVAEALTIATRSGVDGDAVHQALLGGFAQSRILELHGERMLRRDFVAGGVARFHTKDIEIVAKLAQSAGVATPGFDAAARQVERLIADGGGDLDHSALVTIVEQVRH